MATLLSTPTGIRTYIPNKSYGTAASHLEAKPKVISNRGIRDCACWCCQNNSKDGAFVGEFCAPCYELITTGRGGYGTSWIQQLKNRLTAIEDSLLKVRKIVESPYGL